MNPRKKELISRLVSHYARDNGTESLMAYIADTNGGLDACKDLFNVYGKLNPELTGWLTTECQREGVYVDQFIASVQQVLSIFFDEGSAGENCYDVLGLDSNASLSEVKVAYRKLSLQYHPDTAGNDETYDPQKFIEINKAYNSIIDRGSQAVKPSQVERQWSKSSARKVGAGQKKTLVYWGVSLFACLLLVMAFGTQNVKKRAMIAGLTEDRGAFIPPESPISDDVDTNKEIQVTDNLTEIQEQEIERLPSVSLPGFSGDKDIIPDVVLIKDETKPEETQQSSIPVISFNETKLIRKTSEKSVILERKSNKEEEDAPTEVISQEFILAGSEGPSPNPGKVEPDKAVVSVPTPPDIQEAKNNRPVPAEVSEPEAITWSKETATAKLHKHAEVVKVVDEDPLTPQEDQPDDMKRIEAFFADYQLAYAKQDIREFSEYFTRDAVENEVKFVDRMNVYRDLFKKTRLTSLDINVLRWQKTGEEISVTGRFKVMLEYHDGKRLDGQGPIAFKLNRQEGRLRVTEMNYRFDQ